MNFQCICELFRFKIKFYVTYYIICTLFYFLSWITLWNLEILKNDKSLYNEGRGTPVVLFSTQSCIVLYTSLEWVSAWFHAHHLNHSIVSRRQTHEECSKLLVAEYKVLGTVEVDIEVDMECKQAVDRL